MTARPNITKDLSSNDFLSYYYLKEELIAFLKEHHLPASGSKEALTKRIAYFLDTGELLYEPKTKKSKQTQNIKELHEDTIIEENIVCSQQHRAFFKKMIGPSFSFQVSFQNWLKENAGKTYKDAIAAYYQLLEDKKKSPTTIDKQFEYNTYIRAFFADNKGYSLADAITCWNYKKAQKGHHRYEKEDLLHVLHKK